MNQASLVLQRLPARTGELWVGHGAAEALRGAGCRIPDLLRFTIHDGAVLARIAARQFLWLGAGEVIAPPSVLRLSHPCAEFSLAGAQARALLAEVASASMDECGLDAWFPTRVCSLDAVVHRMGDDWRIVCSPAEEPWLGEALAARVHARGGLVDAANTPRIHD